MLDHLERESLEDANLLHWGSANDEAFDRQCWLPQIEEIFFLSTSQKEWTSSEARQKFFHNWTDLYFQNPDVLIAIDPTDRQVALGYLTGCRDSSKFREILERNIPSQLVFQDQFDRFPAHFHINCHPRARGHGVGTSLIKKYEDLLFKAQISGLHLVTSPTAQNVNFYQKLNFTEQLTRVWREAPLLFMGKKL
jgi:ribosomal protein S18 acetylase RimI-like enzyme